MITNNTNTGEYCDHCQSTTASRYEQAAGHITNLCNGCGTRRGLNPYITKRKFEKLIELNIISRNGTPKGDSHVRRK